MGDRLGDAKYKVVTVVATLLASLLYEVVCSLMVLGTDTYTQYTMLIINIHFFLIE